MTGARVVAGVMAVLLMCAAACRSEREATCERVADTTTEAVAERRSESVMRLRVDELTEVELEMDSVEVFPVARENRMGETMRAARVKAKVRRRTEAEGEDTRRDSVDAWVGSVSHEGMKAHSFREVRGPDRIWIRIAGALMVMMLALLCVKKLQR